MRKLVAGIIASLYAFVEYASAVVTPLPTYDMSRSVALQAAEWDFSKMFPIVMSAYYNEIGIGGELIVYASLFVTVLVGIAIRQEDVLIPFILLAIFGQAMFWGGFIPAGWGIWIVALVYIVPATGIIYSLYATKRKG